MKVPVTGGAGCIASVTATAPEQARHVPVILAPQLTGPAAYGQARLIPIEQNHVLTVDLVNIA